MWIKSDRLLLRSTLSFVHKGIRFRPYPIVCVWGGGRERGSLACEPYGKDYFRGRIDACTDRVVISRFVYVQRTEFLLAY